MSVDLSTCGSIIWLVPSQLNLPHSVKVEPGLNFDAHFVDFSAAGVILLQVEITEYRIRKKLPYSESFFIIRHRASFPLVAV